ncbi:MAG: hypothetical protein WBL25_03310, partial [Anaerolineales bacterium]
MQTLRKYTLPLIASLSLVLLVDTLTNGVTEKYLFDSNFYLGIAERGFEEDLLVAPFVYRYGTPLLAGSLHEYTGLSIYKSFKLLTYFGLISQLFGIFLIVHTLTRSRKSAYVGMLVVAFSMYNLKYLLFDVYRADTLAYGLILLCTWFALKRQFLPLILVTAIGLQVREFIAVPLLAFLAIQLQREGFRKSLNYIVVSMISLFIAAGLPRLLIPTVGNEQTVKFSLEGIRQLLYLLSLWRRDINLVYVCFAYFLPFFILYRPSKQKDVLHVLSAEHWIYFLTYIGLVFLLIVVGGTDMERFASYFFLPMAVLVGFLVINQSLISVALVVGLQFIFNRIWLPFPIWDYDLFASFYGGWSDVINPTTLWRYVEVVSYAVMGNIVLHFNNEELRTRIREDR